jgi:hypothetical protein
MLVISVTEVTSRYGGGAADGDDRLRRYAEDGLGGWRIGLRPTSCPHQMPVLVARIVAMQLALVRHGPVAAQAAPTGGLPAVGAAAGDGLVADGCDGPGFPGRRSRGQGRDRDR